MRTMAPRLHVVPEVVPGVAQTWRIADSCVPLFLHEQIAQSVLLQIKTCLSIIHRKI